MKRAVCLMLPLAATVAAAETLLHPTLPQSDVRDWSRPSVVIEGDSGYVTHPGTTIRDWSQPGFRIENGEIYQTIPQSDIRDWSEPSYQVD